MSAVFEPGTGDFPARLEELRRRLVSMRSEDQELRHPSADLVADLETAYEELRVADEEVRSQQDQISQLLERQNVLRWQQERMLALMPVPTLVTDRHGIIRSANAAAASLVSMRVARLLGKPVFTLFDASDRRELRSVLTGTGPALVGRLLTVVPREGDPVQVEVSTADRDGSEVSWMLIAHRADRGAGVRSALPEALSRLAALPSSTPQLQEVLNQAVLICRDSLGAGLEVSLNLGPPDEPTAVSSTSHVAQTIDGAQIEAGGGPCVLAFEQRATVVSEDISLDERWPRLRPTIPESVHGAVAVPIEVGDRLVGALNVYLRAADVPFSLPEEVELLAATLGAVIYEVELAAELRRMSEDMDRALASRSTIEQAKGIVMAERRCSADEAFARLADQSSRQERKLRDVAQSAVDRVTARD